VVIQVSKDQEGMEEEEISPINTGQNNLQGRMKIDSVKQK